MRLILKVAIKNGRLQEFLEQEEARGIGAGAGTSSGRILRPLSAATQRTRSRPANLLSVHDMFGHFSRRWRIEYLMIYAPSPIN